MSDKFEIAETLNRYAVLLDLEQVNQCTDLFSETAELELRIGKAKGKQEIKDLLNKILKFTSGKRHVISNTCIDLNGLYANATCYLTVIDATNSTQIIMTGIYKDELVKEQGSWKLQNRKLIVDPSFK